MNDLWKLLLALFYSACGIAAWRTAGWFARRQAGRDKDDPKKLRRWVRRNKGVAIAALVLAGVFVYWYLLSFFTTQH